MKLTARQCNVIEHIICGQTISTVAKTLGISPRTVESHLARIRRRLGALNTVHAVALYLKSHRKEKKPNG